MSSTPADKRSLFPADIRHGASGLGSTRNLGHPSRDVEIHQESRTIEPKRREGFATSGVAGWIDVDKSASHHQSQAEIGSDNP
jgi:hypothetical protein